MASTSSGSADNSVFDEARYERLRSARGARLGQPLSARATTGSTNDDALLAARQGAAHGSLFIAESQDAGRGRRGRAWFAEPSASLLFSLVLRDAVPLSAVGALPLAAGLAVRSALARWLPQAASEDSILLKWPNDVWVRQRKIAGVLAESQVQGTAPACVVVGIGVNVSTRSFPGELATSATSVVCEGGAADREALLVDTLVELEGYLGLLVRAGVSALQPELLAFDALRGRRVRVETTSGVGAGIDQEGRLLLRVGTSELCAISSGSVELTDE